jgi:DNA ligase-1
MTVSQTLEKIAETSGTNDKMALLREHDSPELRRALKYAMDGFINFHVVKVPKVKRRSEFPLDAQEAWREFFKVADRCARREITGNAAIEALYVCFSAVPPEEEKWMRSVLAKRFSIGLATKSVNKVFPDLIETFEVQLAEKMTDKIVQKLPDEVLIEPKLDGIRCLAIVAADSTCEIYARSGKQITNFDDTIGRELAMLPPAVYDGEIMDEDFTALMRQARRKENADVSNSYLALFDVVELGEWDVRKGREPLRIRRQRLEGALQDRDFKYLKLVEQVPVSKAPEVIDRWHRLYVSRGYEGAMVKNPDLPYSFGRSDAVIKVKSFFDADLTVVGFKEGTGKHVGKLGSILVDFGGNEVNVGSGFDDEQREEVWRNRDKYLGMTAEVRYQEVTLDSEGNPNSLRFPTFVCWRLDK